MQIFHKMWVTLNTLTTTNSKGKSDKGAGFVEYGAIIVFVALVAGIIMTSGLETRIVNGIVSSIDRIFKA